MDSGKEETPQFLLLPFLLPFCNCSLLLLLPLPGSLPGLWMVHNYRVMSSQVLKKESKKSNIFAISRVQCPGGWLQRGDLCLYEVFFTFTLLISVLVIILVILLLLFLIFYTNELFMRRFCKRRVRKANMPTVTSSDKSSSTQSTNCCARPTSSTSSTRSLTTTTSYHPRLHSPDLTYRSLYKCDWPSHYSGLLSMYNSPPSSQITTCTTDLSLLYSLVDKRGSSKEPSPGALDEDTSTSVGDEWQEQKINERMERIKAQRKADVRKSKWDRTGGRERKANKEVWNRTAEGKGGARKDLRDKTEMDWVSHG